MLLTPERAPRTTIQRAHAPLRNRILAGDLAPRFVLSETTLAEELGVSRTPVGEALREPAATEHIRASLAHTPGNLDRVEEVLIERPRKANAVGHALRKATR